ncbi:SDR family oxidoreductase [Rhizobium sullae]|uniref:SDR family oxidoreductase n=1 Tax=Rhizobium sullae TaxID=50338 RepID=UPI002478935F|nr:SDR family oxidoreductase [Rhizobium sullae]
MPTRARPLNAEVLGKVPLGRIGSAGKAVAVALFLLCDDSSYVTGSQYAVDGGLTLPWNFAASVRSLF